MVTQQPSQKLDLTIDILKDPCHSQISRSACVDFRRYFQVTNEDRGALSVTHEKDDESDGLTLSKPMKRCDHEVALQKQSIEKPVVRTIVFVLRRVGRDSLKIDRNSFWPHGGFPFVKLVFHLTMYLLPTTLINFLRSRNQDFSSVMNSNVYRSSKFVCHVTEIKLLPTTNNNYVSRNGQKIS